MNITLCASILLALPVIWPPMYFGSRPEQPASKTPTAPPAPPAPAVPAAPADTKTPPADGAKPAPATTPITPQANAPAPPIPPAGPKEDAKDVDELLVRLETADKDLQSLSASIKYDTISTIDNDKQSRVGSVHFLTHPQVPGEPADRSINVTFDTVTRDNKRSEENRSFILNKGVFVEKVEKDKQINRYKLGPEGKKVDPLKIGEGPFPLPFGQKPDDIKTRFDVTLLPGTDGMTFKNEGVRTYFESCYQLKLIPKPGTKAKTEFDEARIWLQKADLVPIQARTVKPGGGGIDEFFLFNIQTNKPIEPALFDTSTPKGWQEEQKDLK